MPVDLSRGVGTTEAADIFSAALQAASKPEPEVADNSKTETAKGEVPPAKAGSDLVEEGADNSGLGREDEIEEDEFEDEELEDVEGDEPDDSTEEPEEESYDSGYLYRPEGEDKSIFLRAKDPVTGEFSTYDNRQEAEAGMLRQLAFIGELKKQLDETQQAGNAKLAAAEKELTIFRSTMTPDGAKKLLIASKMPEQFRNADITKISDADMPAYKQALIDAEIATEREIRQETERLDAERKADQESENRANRHIRSRTTDVKFFGFKNPEDRMEIAQRMAEKVPGSEVSLQDMTTAIAKAFGNDAADMVLKALISGAPKNDKATEEPKSAPIQKSAPKKAVEPAKVATAKKVADTVRRKKAAAPSAATPTMPTTARDMIMQGFDFSRNKQVRR